MATDRKIRRAQLIQPWGVGSVVPFPNDESLIIGGINYWDNPSSEFEIRDERLAKRLRVSGFRMPPDYIAPSKTGGKMNENANKFIYAYRFPQWFYCPVCKHMEHVSLTKAGPVVCKHEFKDEEFRKKHKPSRMVPERFIVACPDGHLMDFPFLDFIHAKSDLRPEEYRTHKNIVRFSGGKSAALSGIAYKCLDCGEINDFGGITAPGALKDISFPNADEGMCPGYMPWFGNKYEKCSHKTEDLRVIQRGGTNVWFAETKSSIYIPSALDTDTNRIIRKIVDDSDIFYALEDGCIPNRIIERLAYKYHVDFEELKKYIEEKLKGEVEDTDKDIDEDSYRKEEYDVLKRDCGNDDCELYVKNNSIDKYDSSIRSFFKSVSLVYKLRETRAFIGFSRLEPANKTIEEFRKHLSSDNDVNWIPAIQVNGEGIMVEFNETAVEKWKNNKEVLKRCEKITNNLNTSAFGKKNPIELLNPEYVLIHTFAHILIAELSKKCGYGSSSLRERLYVSKSKQCKMLGVLIYTSSGDSEGSLGGLVREGQPGKLEDSIITALKNAEWCSSDPICIESNGQGPDSCNLAACHNCALLPETCCENGNRLLDRGMLVDSSFGNKTGFFQKLLDDIE